MIQRMGGRKETLDATPFQGKIAADPEVVT
jgi:hypothetical protein